MRAQRSWTKAIYVILLTVVLATTVGALGEMPSWESPSWWWTDSAWGTLVFYGSIVSVGLGVGWLLRRSLAGIAQYDRFDRFDIDRLKSCDVLVLPLSVGKQALALEVPQRTLTEDDLDELHSVAKGTPFEATLSLFIGVVRKQFEPDVLLLLGDRSHTGPSSAATDPIPRSPGEPSFTLLSLFDTIGRFGIQRADGKVVHLSIRSTAVDMWDLQACYEQLRGHLEALSRGQRRRFVLEITSGTATMSVALSLLGITEDQILAHKTIGRPHQFFDARVHLVSPFTVMSGS